MVRSLSGLNGVLGPLVVPEDALPVSTASLPTNQFLEPVAAALPALALSHLGASPPSLKPLLLRHLARCQMHLQRFRRWLHHELQAMISGAHPASWTTHPHCRVLHLL